MSPSPQAPSYRWRRSSSTGMASPSDASTTTSSAGTRRGPGATSASPPDAPPGRCRRQCGGTTRGPRSMRSTRRGARAVRATGTDTAMPKTRRWCTSRVSSTTSPAQRGPAPAPTTPPPMGPHRRPAARVPRRGARSRPHRTRRAWRRPPSRWTSSRSSTGTRRVPGAISASLQSAPQSHNLRQCGGTTPGPRSSTSTRRGAGTVRASGTDTARPRTRRWCTSGERTATCPTPRARTPDRYCEPGPQRALPTPTSSTGPHRRPPARAPRRGARRSPHRTRRARRMPPSRCGSPAAPASSSRLSLGLPGRRSRRGSGRTSSAFGASSASGGAWGHTRRGSTSGACGAASGSQSAETAGTERPGTMAARRGGAPWPGRRPPGSAPPSSLSTATSSLPTTSRLTTSRWRCLPASCPEEGDECVSARPVLPSPAPRAGAAAARGRCPPRSWCSSSAPSAARRSGQRAGAGRGCFLWDAWPKGERGITVSRRARLAFEGSSSF
mmetsp:Transcript_31031/g.83051  ORF Transcript_31031/g.83051 Transcript_31031/m.83051 type:complete len:498 (+) Transcript_31031:153-1646(+)